MTSERKVEYLVVSCLRFRVLIYIYVYFLFFFFFLRVTVQQFNFRVIQILIYAFSFRYLAQQISKRNNEIMLAVCTGSEKYINISHSAYRCQPAVVLALFTYVTVSCEGVAQWSDPTRTRSSSPLSLMSLNGCTSVSSAFKTAKRISNVTGFRQKFMLSSYYREHAVTL